MPTLLIILAVFTALRVATSGMASSSDVTRESLLETRTAMQDWIENERLISKERHEWKLTHEMLNARIGLVKTEIEQLEESIANAEQSITEYEEERAELHERNEDMKRAAGELKQLAAGLEARIKRILTRVPEPVRDKVEVLSQQIPKDPNNTEASLSNRFQNVVGVLNEVNKFHGEISMSSELRDVADGNSVAVTAVYVGLGQGYYHSANGKYAGLGTAGADGWTWTARDDAAPQISEVVGILKNDKVASFVKLPVDIK